MASRNEYLQYVLEQLAALPRVTSRHMFGGFGLYCDGLFFALIFSDTLYFKVGDANREEVKMEHPFLMFVEPCDFGAAGQNHVPETVPLQSLAERAVRELYIGGA